MLRLSRVRGAIGGLGLPEAAAEERVFLSKEAFIAVVFRSVCLAGEGLVREASEVGVRLGLHQSLVHGHASTELDVLLGLGGVCVDRGVGLVNDGLLNLRGTLHLDQSGELGGLLLDEVEGSLHTSCFDHLALLIARVPLGRPRPADHLPGQVKASRLDGLVTRVAIGVPGLQSREILGRNADRAVCLLAVGSLLACGDFYVALGAFEGRDGLLRVQQGVHVVLTEGLFGELVVKVAVGVVVA